MAVAFGAGLWIGGLLGVADAGTGVAVLGGAVILGIGGARLLGNALRARRLARRAALNQSGRRMDVVAAGAPDDFSAGE